VGLLGSSVVVATVVLASQLPGSAPTGEPRRSERHLEDVGDRPPEGRWLVQGSGEVTVLGAGGAPSRTWAVEGFWASDISPDGSLIVGVGSEFVTVSGQPGTTDGVSLSPGRDLVIGDIESGELSAVARAADNESFGQPVWSPDGERILYSMAAWQFDIAPGAGHPGQPIGDTICVLRIGDGSNACFGDTLTDARSYAWSPDGSRAIVSDGQRVSLLSPDTGDVSTVVDITSPGQFRDGLLAAGLGEGVVVLDLSWSPSGEYLAGGLSTTTRYSVPVVFRLDGSIAAFGQPNGNDQHVTWSPTEDLLAYSVGEWEPGSVGTGWAVHLLDPSSGATVLNWAVTGDDPRVFDMFFSPSGRWLALVGTPWRAVDGIRLVDLSSPQAAIVVRVVSKGEFVPLIDWGPEAS
jgi:Tol biopolymer transport system component